MGYPAFNKVTIQLPIPSATMTKAEYKEAYGIDLDDLDFAKVTLLVDGKEKYAVDEIKNVSDDVLIYAGGKVLTIGDDGNVSVTSGAYSVMNAKPLYYHPVIISNVSQSVGRISFWIINTNPEAFTKATFLDFLHDLDDSAMRLNVTGSLVKGSDVIIVSDVNTYSADVHNIGGILATARTYDSTILEDFINQTDTSVLDPVNKIN